MKQVFYDDDARAHLLGGAKALYDAVKVTYGPKGRNVVISRTGKGPTVTHDGVTVAESIDLSEAHGDQLGYQQGVELIKDSASKLNKLAGDGTTTVTVLTYNILEQANRMIAAGHNPMELRKGIESAGLEVVEHLGKLAEEVADSPKRIAEIAGISAGDKELGDKISSLITKIGKDGVVNVEHGQGLEVETSVVEGLTIDRGWMSAFFVTDEKLNAAVYENPAILVTDKRLVNPGDMIPLIEKMIAEGKKDVVIFADDVDGEMMRVLVINKLNKVFRSVVVRAPSFGENRRAVLEDIALATGATLVSDTKGMQLKDADTSILGVARKVIVGKDETTIIEGLGKPGPIKDRVEQLRKQIDNASSEYEAEQYQKRLAALTGRVAVIRVGGKTETEIEEKKYRVDDAVAATKAALAEGIVPGGGVTLVNIASLIDAGGSDSISAGRQILKQVLRVPFTLITANAGLNSEALLSDVEKARPGMGVDVNDPSGKLVDVKKVGVIDPVRVTREAVQNAVSIAATAITMGALVVDVPEGDANVGNSQAMV